MKNTNLSKIIIAALVIVNFIILLNWVFKTDSTEVYAQVNQTKAEIGRYQLEYVPSMDGSDPRYIVFDTATGVFWEGKGRIENIDLFCIYSESDIRAGKIGNHIVQPHIHK